MRFNLIKLAKKGKELVSSMVGKPQRDAIESDYEEWAVQVMGWDADKLDKIPVSYVQKYLKQVYFKGGVGSWKKKKRKKQ